MVNNNQLVLQEAFVRLLFRATEKVAKRSRAFRKRGKQNLFALPKRFIKKGFLYPGLAVKSFRLVVHESLCGEIYCRCK